MYSSDALNLRATRAPAQGWWTKSARRRITPPHRAGRDHETAGPAQTEMENALEPRESCEQNPLLGGE